MPGPSSESHGLCNLLFTRVSKLCLVTHTVCAETAILACSAYVDLNPVRAGVAEVPEESQYTSVYERVQAEKAGRKEKARVKVRKRQASRSRSKVAAGGGQAT